MPDFSLEMQCAGRVAGIDEAGRGPWAGPVVAAAVLIDRTAVSAQDLAGLDDSKKLKASAREDMFARLHGLHGLMIGVGRAEVKEIDTLNILKATYLAMERAFAQLPKPIDAVLVDGNQAPGLPCKVQTVVKGDSKSFSIAAASIVAKVIRDREMMKLADAFPGYGWETNMGYGTAAHQAGLARLGVTPHHRKSYAPVRALTENISASQQ